MIQPLRKKIIKKSFIIPIFCGIIFSIFTTACAKENAYDFNSAKKRIYVCEGKGCFETNSQSGSVSDFLREKKISYSEEDFIFPNLEQKIYSGSRINIIRAKKIKAIEKKESVEFVTLLDTVEEAIWDYGKITLAEDDITEPDRKTLLNDGMEIAVTHVIIKEETEQEKIDFKTKTNEDDKLGWREKKLTQKGEEGIKEVKYKVVYHDGKEISRKVLEKNILKEPVEEIVTQGTYVKVGKKHTGLGTWYAFKGGLFAASPWLPMGSYAKVTNKANGKSVIVQINDRGPFGENRIIDLDKVAFAKIASLGAGVIDVKVEEVLN